MEEYSKPALCAIMEEYLKPTLYNLCDVMEEQI